ncbi:MAG: hypothetical protein IKV66_15570 [Clostridia bacterium]|nr:hypothetical protein [Clostridia bacterium]
MASDKKKEFKYHKILALDGCDIFRHMHAANGIAPLTALKDGKLDISRFEGVLDESLETEKLAAVYKKHAKEIGVPYLEHNCTRAVISVSFDFAIKEFEKYGRRFVRHGHDVADADMTDHICVRDIDGEPTLIAVEVPYNKDTDYAHVENPIGEEILGKYFSYDSEKQCYCRTGKALETAVKCEEIRAVLYRDGFSVDGIHYVRYKRSAGSSRSGHCLFIAEPLYDDMMAWSSCGLSAEVDDQASWQAYISLTLSSIESILKLPKKAILIIPDQTSVFKTHAVCVRQTEDGMLTAAEEETEVENVIWDGEALMDVSVFNDNGYGEHSMMLLRNRFFKTCAFNTNLQLWFQVNDIKQIRQLAGFTTARDVTDIKLVITESSLKYLKFLPKEMPLKEKFKLWLDAAYEGKDTSDFGVVKTDHYPTQMNGNMSYTSYQIINTMPFSYAETENFLAMSLEYLEKLQKRSTYMRFHLNHVGLQDDIDSKTLTVDNYRQRLIHDLTTRTPQFEHTSIYKDFRTEVCKIFKDKLKSGRVLVDGNYQTLFGNPIEFLCAIIDKDYKVNHPLAITGDNAYCSHYRDGDAYLCIRSPHITMGNLYLAENTPHHYIDSYFNLNPNILCVNAIRNNIQQQLNGCDYDSDAVLVTWNTPLRYHSALIRDAFPIPVCKIDPIGKASYTNTPESLAQLDQKISDNKIGEIINLSQFLNSLFWDEFHRLDCFNNRGEFQKLKPLYYEICILAVLSGMEIDKAKRLYDVDTGKVLGQLKRRKQEFVKSHGGKLPAFYEFMTEGNVTSKSDKNVKLNTPMCHIYDIVESLKTRSEYTHHVNFRDLFDLDTADGDSNDSHRKKNIIDAVLKAGAEIRSIKIRAKDKKDKERKILIEQADKVFQSCLKTVSKYIVNDHVLHLLLTELDLGTKSKSGVSSVKTLLFACLIYEEGGRLLSRLKDADNYQADDLLFHQYFPELNEDAYTEYLYGHKYVHVVLGKTNNEDS